MLYSNLAGEKVSHLGFGAMRLPTCENGAIDETQVRDMVALAFANGVNYFDTAYPYHGGESERVMGRLLAEYPRDSWFLADKYPGHQLFSDGHNPKRIFEEQLEKCGVDYFDFYLLHNVYECSMPTYLDPEIGIIDFFREQKRLGRIKHLGFSTHAQTKGLEEFLDACGEDMEFCQLQLNYLDWTLQDAKGKYELLTKRGIPVVAMEPLRGGKLAALSAENAAKLAEARPDESPAAWSFRFIQDLPNVRVVLSGMSNVEQLEQNIATFAGRRPLGEGEVELLMEIGEGMHSSVPCTACRYCMESCPIGLEIPYLLEVYNNMLVAPSASVGMSVEFLEDGKKPEACIGCGACSGMCPQGIDVPAALADLAKRLESIPSWRSICLEREAAAKKNE